MAHLHPLTLSVCTRLGTFLIQLEPGDWEEGVSEWLWMV